MSMIQSEYYDELKKQEQTVNEHTSVIHDNGLYLQLAFNACDAKEQN